MDKQGDRKNRQNTKLFAIGLIFLFLIMFGIERILIGQFKWAMLERARDINASFIKIQAKKHLSDNDFLSKDHAAHMENFEKFYQEIKTPDIFRIKIWNRDSVVIFSDEKALIGKKLKNTEVEEAFLGKLPVEIERPVREEHIYEKGYREFLEIYIPISSSESDEIIGVVEPYHSLEKLNKTLYRTRLYLWSFIALILTFFLIISTHFGKEEENRRIVGKIEGK